MSRITQIEQYDWPWVCVVLATTDWPADIRASLEGFAQANDSDEDVWEPYIPEHFAGWSVVEPNGIAHEIRVPKVDFATGDIEWR